MQEHIPTYQGEWCHSGCFKRFECHHAEHFDQIHGIRRLHTKSDRRVTRFI